VQVTVYSDFTSPACDALNEVLAALAPGVEVRWRGVQSDPGLPSPMRAIDRRALDRLHDEVADVRRLDSSLELTVPTGKPNTAGAIVAVAAVTRRHQTRAAAFRDAIFRAYWRDGLDISRPQELRRLAAASLVPGWVELDDPDAAADADAWELDWAAERLGGVPRAIRSDGRILWGMRPHLEVAAFFRGE